ncbi:McrC family protein [Desulfobacca acetoxidans]|uniref:5-methylcytosine restriction system component-like protein n=1 Tax=Desulfobacca acetoxidans (strain ATCC 700848 / DSM 11109 / ASRB2) TaxID=880072 RepID=F2NGY6_DESAR|nr:5-methylcytosine restriction system component-like protein [Desulfobacca acetoxidans]AEB08757.1 5-methylcytosine restriction system component-like protein [Desulfobacca acetoxidans DSM 11109]
MSELSVSIQEWQTLEPIPGSPLAGIGFEEPTTKRIAAELTQSGKLEILELRHGLSIRATSYVGSLKLGQISLNILPKLAVKPLLTLLRYAYNFRRLTLFLPLAHGYAPRTFQDLLIHQLAAEVAELFSRGLHRRYEAVHTDLQSPRGKIDFQSLMRQGGLSQARLPCRHHPRLENTLLNRFILSGLLLSVQLTEDRILRTLLRRLVSFMQDSIIPIKLDRETVRLVRRMDDRMTKAYRPARGIIELLLDGLGITLDGSSSSTQAPGFLFDMNRFFQELMSKFLRDNLNGLTVVDEYRLKGMMAYDPLFNPLRRRPPDLRPDYLIFNRHQLVAIIDAKYRDLWEKPLPREMLYQLTIYALSRFNGVKSAVILYPTEDSAAKEARIKILDPIKGQNRAQVILRPVNLLKLESLLFQSQGISLLRQRQVFANNLVFGPDSHLN